MIQKSCMFLNYNTFFNFNRRGFEHKKIKYSIHIDYFCNEELQSLNII